MQHIMHLHLHCFAGQQYIVKLLGCNIQSSTALMIVDEWSRAVSIYCAIMV